MTTTKKIVLLVVMLSYFVTAIDSSIVVTGLTHIAADLKLDQVTLSWVQNVYVLSFGGFILLGGRLSDAYGRKLVLDISLVLFGVGSLLAGAATTGWVMIAARLMQGVGASMLAPTSMALLVDYFAGAERIKAISWYSSMSGLGSCCGLLLGGFLASFYTWRIGFYINVPIMLVMIVLSNRVFKNKPNLHSKFDLSGACTSVAAVFCLVYAIDGAANSLPWLIAAALLTVIFIKIEKTAKIPVMPLGLFCHATRSNAYIIRLLFVGAMMGFWFFLSEFMQHIFGFSPLLAGMSFLPLTLATFIGAIKVPALVVEYGNKRVLCAGICCQIFGFLLLLLLDKDSSYLWGIGLPTLFLGIGQGLEIAPLTNLGVIDVDSSDAGAASGVVNAAHQIGGSLGLSLMVSFSAGAADMGSAFHTAMLVGAVISAAMLIFWLRLPSDKPVL